MITLGGRQADWTEAHCKVPEGKLHGDYLLLAAWQRDTIYKIYNNDPRHTFTVKEEDGLLGHFISEQERSDSMLALLRCREQSPARARQLEQKLEQQSAVRVGIFASYCCQVAAW